MLPGGKVRVTIEPLGGVFGPVPGKSLRPAYSWGHDGPGGTRPVIFQCPVSAVPEVVWDLLQLWHECRLMKCLPEVGGWVDQAKLVRRSFPVFEQEMVLWEDQNRAPGRTAAALAGLAAASQARGKR